MGFLEERPTLDDVASRFDLCVTHRSRAGAAGNLLATKEGNLVYLDFGMMSGAPQYARYAIMAHVVHLVNRDYLAMCKDYYTLQFMDPSIDTAPIAPALAAFFDDVLQSSVTQLNFKVRPRARLKRSLFAEQPTQNLFIEWLRLTVAI